MPSKFDPKFWSGDHFQVNHNFDELYKRINDLNPTLVIDAGCGRNLHKPYIKNLFGFDASPFPEIDLQSTILDAPFAIGCADAVLSLGSVQFISRDYVIQNMEKIISWVKPGGLIEMRVRTYEPSKNFIMPVHHFFWEEELIDFVSKKYNLEISNMQKYRSESNMSNEEISKKFDLSEQSEIFLAEKQLWGRTIWTWRTKQ